ncbi:Cupin 2, conserved barrel [Rubrobacter xylanophilus DSM 9941]|uniref:Cupin 2, conserved barrel n=1 Tax=Rubrobacter xylanophilus (strain DSM 9941 / JCM 11954 / NBRC 16129 / PRD-1) TaxID=266117 RepID=Q1AZQ1_RUBXD|nr:cupin domain-containing protein [Rubrobacter xylanophilus]ABG03127.1 Cupin 2, conserved barrel [Rubrobacter xylanophilus DSM 9941]
MRRISPKDTKTERGPGEWFTGEVWMDPSPPRTPEAGVFRVLFAPGARTNWHTHPEGQVLYVVSGRGLAQAEGGPVVEMGPGDVVTFAPGEKHWHGAAPDSCMLHVAINPAASTDGGTEWLEPVGDEEYPG